MKILVFSDSHGDISRMKQIVFSNSTDTDLVVHLGDRKSDLDEVMLDYPRIPRLAVVGNCDAISMFSLSSLLEHSFTFEGVKIYMTHGHHKDVKSGMFSLIREAKSKGYNVVLYGHTHIAKHEFKDNIHYFNPGSISYPRNNGKCSYGVIKISNGNVDLKIVEVD